jgi:hypothetical protein
MCKVAGVTKINNKNRDEVWLFMQILGDYMSIGNDHGLGYAAFDGDGKLFGERWLHNNTAFTDLSQTKGINAEKMANIYSFFGDKVLRDDARAIILHTRFATCGRGIANTHPFIDDLDNPTVATIHNGVISNDDQFEKKYSTCDSEVLVHLYKKWSVNKDIKLLNKFAGDLSGWYTVLNLATDANKKPVMDIYTMNGRLTSYYIPALDVRVFATEARNIQATAEFMNLELTEPKDILKHRAYRVDVVSGEITHRVQLVKPKEPRFVYAEGSFEDFDFRESFFGGIDNVSRNWTT